MNMSEPPKETNDCAPIRSALIAPASEAARLLEAIVATPDLALAAQSGVPQAEAVSGVDWFDDRRVLVARAGVEAVVIGSSNRIGFEMGQLAAASGIHVWRRPPLGRSFAEALEAAQHARAASGIYRVCTFWDHERIAVREALRGVGDGRPLFTEAYVGAPGPPLASWRAGELEAGGGVLLQDAYAALEQIVALRGLPDSVSATTERCRRRANEPPRETEDVAVAVLRYSNGVAMARATWDIHPASTEIHHHGPVWSTKQDGAEICAGNVDGSTESRQGASTDPIRDDLTAFVRLIRGESAREENLAAIGHHLMVSAVLDAAYLSARTGQPESPRRLYEVHGISTT